LEKRNENLRKTTDAQSLEIASLRETNLNLVEALNILGRSSRLQTQSKLWDNYDFGRELQDCVSAKSKDSDNYFDANE